MRNARGSSHGRSPLDRIGSGAGSFELYEDDGVSLDYQAQHAHTAIAHSAADDGANTLIIGPTEGAYPGQPAVRSYKLWLHADARPSVIEVDGQAVSGWKWDQEQTAAVVVLPDRSIHERVRAEWH